MPPLRTPLHELLESGAITEQEVVGHNRGGLTVTFKSIRGFVPASHLADYGRASEAERAERLSSHVGHTLPVKIIEVDRKQHRLVLSHRLAEQELREQRRASRLDLLQPGQTVEGRVTAIRPFGVFVDIGGVDGLIHLSELDWQLVKNPHDVVTVGDKVQVMVLRLDENRQRIALSRRRALPNPWELIIQRYHAGQPMLAGSIPGTVPSRRHTSKNMDAPEPPAMEAMTMGMISSPPVCKWRGTAPQDPGAAVFAWAATKAA